MWRELPSRKSVELDAITALREQRPVMLHGEPGSGLTSFAKRLTELVGDLNEQNTVFTHCAETYGVPNGAAHLKILDETVTWLLKIQQKLIFTQELQARPRSRMFDHETKEDSWVGPCARLTR